MKNKTCIPLLVSILFCISGTVLLVLTESTERWGNISQSGTILRVPWKTFTSIGLWTTCTFRESGFPREEVYTNTCYPTTESEHISRGTIKACQGSIVLATICSTLVIVLSCVYLVKTMIGKTMADVPLLMLVTVLSLLTVTLSSLAVLLFWTKPVDGLAFDWSVKIGIGAPLCQLVATFGFGICIVQTKLSLNRINDTEQQQQQQQHDIYGVDTNSKSAPPA